uniref:Opis11KD n=1 Tax=Opistophthalmus carinatus TaxID=190115 RepID=Q5VJS7_OPICA|nr:Opis11KD [Opistophthalmus carinatus]
MKFSMFNSSCIHFYRRVYNLLDNLAITSYSITAQYINCRLRCYFGYSRLQPRFRSVQKPEYFYARTLKPAKGNTIQIQQSIAKVCTAHLRFDPRYR